MTLLALGALLLAQAATPVPPALPPTPRPNIPLGPPLTISYRCSNGGMVKIGLTAHAASVLYNGRAFVYARGVAPDGGIMLFGSGMQWELRGRALTATRGVGARATVLERCLAVGP
jgi:hypothetical protein